MPSTTLKQQREQIIYPNLPLAVYREIAAHLQQLKGIKTILLPPTAQPFAYQQSQIGGLEIEYTVEFDLQEQKWIEEILNYYALRYGTYREIGSKTSPEKGTL